MVVEGGLCAMVQNRQTDLVVHPCLGLDLFCTQTCRAKWARSYSTGRLLKADLQTHLTYPLHPGNPHPKCKPDENWMIAAPLRRCPGVGTYPNPPVKQYQASLQYHFHPGSPQQDVPWMLTSRPSHPGILDRIHQGRLAHNYPHHLGVHTLNKPEMIRGPAWCPC